MEDKYAGLGTVLTTAVPPVVWGSTYAVTQVWLPPDRPLFVATVRALPIGLVMLLFLRRLPAGHWWGRALLLGTLNIGLFFALLFLAAYRLPSGLGATTVATSPLVMMLLAWPLLGERPTRPTILATAAAMAGVVVLVLRNGVDEPIDPLGLAAALAAIVVTSLGYVLTKRWAPPADVLTVTSWQLVAGGLVLLPLALTLEGPPPALDVPAVLALAYLAVVGGGVAYVLWFRGLARMSATSVSVIGLVNPVVGTLLGVVLLAEPFGPVHVAAMLLVLGGVLVAQPPVRARLRRLVPSAAVPLSAAPPPGPLHADPVYPPEVLPAGPPAGEHAGDPDERTRAWTPTTSPSSASDPAARTWPAASQRRG